MRPCNQCGCALPLRAEVCERCGASQVRPSTAPAAGRRSTERPAPAPPDPVLNRRGRWQVEPVLFGLFIAAGLGLIVWSSVFWSRGRRLSQGRRTQGTVIELKSAGGRPQTWAPVVRFYDERGREFTVTSPVSSNEPDRVGDTVPVVYNAQDPTDAEIESFGQLWFIPAGMDLVGAGFVAMGMAGILSDRRRRVT